MPTATAWRRTRRRRSPGSRSPPTAATARRSSRSRCSASPAAAAPQDQARSGGAAREGRQARPRRRRLQSRAALSRGPAGPPGRRARRRTVARRRRRRQPRGAIRARDPLQGRQRRAEGPGRRREAARRRGAQRQRRARRSNTRSRCSTAPASPRTRARAAALFRKAAHKGNAVAQNRLARILATGRGAAGRPGRGRRNGTPSPRRAAPPTSGSKTTCRAIKDDERAAGENAARLWLAARAAAVLTLTRSALAASAPETHIRQARRRACRGQTGVLRCPPNPPCSTS